MSGQQSPVAPESRGSEAVEESSTKAEPSPIIDGEQLWRDIQVETEFECYQDYLNNSVQYRSDLEALSWWMFRATSEVKYGSQVGYDSCYIVDVSAHEDWPLKFSTRCQYTSGLKLLAALRQPPKHVGAQVVLWSIGKEMSPNLLDKLGLGLQIAPQFFLAVIETLGARRQRIPFGKVVDTRPHRSNHVVIHRVVATVVRHYPIDKPAAPPIILIAGDLNVAKDFMCVADQSVSKSAPFTLPKDPVERYSSGFPDQAWLDIYKETFSTLAEINHDETRCTAAIIAGVLIPLLYINCLHIRMQRSQLRRTFLELQAPIDMNNVNHQLVDQTSSKLHHERFWLRRSLEDSEDEMSHLGSYLSAEDANYLSDSSAYLRIKQETDQTHTEARRLDTEVRYYLQLVVVNLSLEESRKSIELSNHQIQEGKRVKICG